VRKGLAALYPPGAANPIFTGVPAGRLERALHSTRELPGYVLPLLVVAGAAFVLQAAGGPSAWRLERGLVLAEPWRLVTGHLVHLGWPHLAMNLAGAALVWLLLGHAFTAGQWSMLMFACIAGVDMGLLWLSPGVEWYAGFSGVLHGLLAAGAVASLARTPAMAGLLLTGLALKLVLEQQGAGLAGTARLIGAPVIVDAHLYGALAGAAGALLLRTWRSRSTSAPR
jgi:rhomboid family GlyGly-CTERM serine protease